MQIVSGGTFSNVTTLRLCAVTVTLGSLRMNVTRNIGNDRWYLPGEIRASHITCSGIPWETIGGKHLYPYLLYTRAGPNHLPAHLSHLNTFDSAPLGSMVRPDRNARAFTPLPAGSDLGARASRSRGSASTLPPRAAGRQQML
jgi:hypothetical protein